eukprot:NODE_29855_length_434_cov_1.068404.p2 GENE.NODE_29855_length_434_cov_1.068404~~NODE_29855_length_434_cov_1.068404.p2  ORF type:complete len:62 (-),score=8.29 NODE_29855_length_434_cov_1.068404:171-356(-)
MTGLVKSKTGNIFSKKMSLLGKKNIGKLILVVGTAHQNGPTAIAARFACGSAPSLRIGSHR